MKEKKNIDRLFQEKFKDFESEPHSRNWDEIASRLDRKDRKRPFVIPLWFKLGGVAAVIAVIISGILFTQNQDPFSNEPGVVIEEHESTNQKELQQDSINAENEFTEPASQISAQDSIENSGSNNSGSNNKSKSNPAYAGTDTATGKSANKDQNTNTSIASQNKAVAENSSSEIKARTKNKTKKEANNSSENYSGNKAIALNSTSSKENSSEKNKAEIINPGKQENSSSAEIVANNNIAVDSSTTKDALIKNSEEMKEEENALAQVEEQNKRKDKDEDETELNAKKLRLSTFAAPVFYTNAGGGNELSNQFAGNSSSSEVTFSYGVKVAYDLGNKLKIRTGISKVNMSYNIENIIYSPTAASVGFDNINPIEDNLEIRTEASPLGNGSGSGTGLMDSDFSDNSLASSVFTPGEINQQFGFIEIPVELEYALIDKKFGLNIIGGGSSLFLDANRVDLIAGESRTELGEATNINNTSFSTNIGLGMDYELSDKFSVSVEPILKYQINTFTDVSNVKPMNFGIYSGLNFKF